MRFVDHDQAPYALLAVLPQVIEHGEGGSAGLGLRGESAEVDDGGVGLIVDVIRDAALSPGPQLPVRDAEVLEPHLAS